MILLTGWAVIAAFPIFWMISTSFKPDTQWFAWPPFYFPHPPTLSNYLNVWFGAEEYATTQYAISSQKPLISLLNSTVIAGTATFLSVLFRIGDGLRGLALSHPVRDAHVPAADAAYDPADRDRGAAVALRCPWLARFMTGLILIYFLTPAPRRMDDQELHR